MKRLILTLVTLAYLALPTLAFAQDTPEPNYGLNGLAVASTVVYGIIGVVLSILGYFAFDRVAGLDLQRELVEDQNIAIGIMLAGVYIGIAIIVSAAITG